MKVQNKYDCVNEVIWLMAMRMRLKMKNWSHRYDINIPRPIHRHKHKMCLNIIMVYVISNDYAKFEAQFMKKLSNTEKSVAYKKVCISIICKSPAT